MGMLIFKEAGVEYLVMETGLGGRLDATNVVEKPLACIITSISRDHTEYLGDTLEAIAGEKAGIIKAGVPVIYDASQPGPASVIAAKAKEMGSPAWPMEPSFYEMKTQSREGITFTFAYPGGEKAELAIPYVAKYQMMNASLAFYTMHILQDVHDIPKNVLAEGLSKIKMAVPYGNGCAGRHHRRRAQRGRHCTVCQHGRLFCERKRDHDSVHGSCRQALS